MRSVILSNKRKAKYKKKEKNVISISILIHIYIEMNPDANEGTSVYLKQVPWQH